MSVHRSITFRVPYTIDEVYEVISRPKDFFSILPLPLKFKSFRGSNVVVYMNAFGFRGNAVFNFVVTKGVDRFTLESSMVGGLTLGFFRSPRMNLIFRVSAMKIEEGTEISFELYVRSSPPRERLSGVAADAEKFISGIPESISEVLKRVSTKPETGVQRKVAELPKPTITPLAEVEVRVVKAVEAGGEEKEQEITPATSVSEMSREEGIKAAGETISDIYSDLLEDPVAVYKLTMRGKSITTFKTKYSLSLIKTLLNICTKNRSPIYAVLRGEKQLVRLIVESTGISGMFLEQDGQILKGKEARELLEKSGEEFICAVFTVSKELLESLRK